VKAGHAVLMEPRPVRATALLGLGLVGAAIAVLAVAGPVTIGGIALPGAAQPARAMLVASTASLVACVLFMPARQGHPTDRVELALAGAVGLGGLSLLAVAGAPALLAILLLLLAGLHATRPSPRPFIERLRGPLMAALLLGLAGIFLNAPATPGLARVGALGLVLGLVAAAGLVPFLRLFDPMERTSSSGLVWTAFLAPNLAVVLAAGLIPGLGAAAGVFSDGCLGFGLLNLGWGVLAAWRAPEPAAAWRHSFTADWGLALVGLGLQAAGEQGVRASFLILLSLVLVRLPLYLYARPVLLGIEPERRRPLGLMLGLALAGAAPFAGFAGRLLLLEGAMQLAWPLAVVLLLAMLAYLGHSVRLGATLGRPRGRAAAGVALALALSLAIGVLPGLFLGLAGY
jgi:hypothetical protein